MKTNYIGYIKYVLEHKKNVFKVCWKNKIYIHAFTHDLSKFLPSEFFPYAKYFYGEYGVGLKKYLDDIKDKIDENEWNRLYNLGTICKADFKNAWHKHYRRNKHHWNHWVGKDMPVKYIKQMICDWKAMSIKFGDTAQEYYMNNYDDINLSLNSRLQLELLLGLIDETAVITNVTWKDYCSKSNTTMKEDLFKLNILNK